MKLLRTFIFVTYFVNNCIASVELCNSGIQSKVCKSVATLENYIAETPPTPFPAHVNIVINIIDVNDVDEDAQTMSMQIKVTLSWKDNRLFVNRTKADIEKYAN